MTTLRTLAPTIAPAADSLPTFVTALTAENPARPFWIHGESGTVRSLADFIAEARAIANWLQVLGFSPGDRLALVTDRFGPWALTALGAALANVTVVPLPTTASPAILASLLVRARPRGLLVGPEVWSALFPVFIGRGEPFPATVIIDAAVGLLPPGLHSLDDAAFAPEAPPVTAPERPIPAALFYNNGSRGRAEAAAIGFEQLRDGLALLRRNPSLAGDSGPDRPHAVLRCPTTAVGNLFDLWRPLLVGAPIVDLSPIASDPTAIAAAIRAHQPVGVSLAARDVATVFPAVPPAPAAPPARVAMQWLDRLARLGAAIDENAGTGFGRGFATALRRASGNTLRRAWFFVDLPDDPTLAALRASGVEALRTYHVSESAVPCAFVPDTERERAGYRVADGFAVRILDPGPDGVGEIAIASSAVAVETLDISRTLRPLERADGFLPTGDIGRIDAAGRLHLLGTRTFALRAPDGSTVAGETIARAFDGGPWQQLVPMPEALLWPDDPTPSPRWIAVVHGADAVAARAFLKARNAVTPPAHRIAGLVCSPAAFPVGTHGRLRREALLGALRSAFAAHATTPADRARAVDWLEPQ